MLSVSSKGLFLKASQKFTFNEHQLTRQIWDGFNSIDCSWIRIDWLPLTQDTGVICSSTGSFGFYRESVTIDTTGAYWLCSKRKNIRGCELGGNTLAKSFVCMSTVEL